MDAHSTSGSESDFVMGAHTVVHELKQHPELLNNTILQSPTQKRAAGAALLPPFLVVMGDRRRVESAAKLLDQPALLHDVAQKGGVSHGRVNVAVGLWKGVPIALLEHQMGCSATEILLREVVSRQHMSTDFTLHNKDGSSRKFVSDAKYVIRVGTAAGINHSPEWTPSGDAARDAVFKTHDVVVATHQVGASGADIESLTGSLNLFSPKTAEKALQKMQEIGYEVNNGWPVLPLDPKLYGSLSKHIQQQLEGTGIAVREAANVSKDSLYAEADESTFTALRDQFNVGSSEMEFSTIARVAQQMTHQTPQKVKAALAVATLGVIPGGDWSEDEVSIGKAQNACLIGAFETLRQIAESFEVRE